VIGGVHTNVRTFTVSLGITVNIKQYLGGTGGKAEIYAERIFINGTINGIEKGYDGGNGGPGGPNGIAGMGGIGGLNGGGSGGNGIDNVNGAGGGGAGGGGGYGGSGGPGGSGGTGVGPGGGGGSGGGIYGTATGLDIDMGSGSGGGGGAGGTGILPLCITGDTGGSGVGGTRGGGAVLLSASYVRVSGSIVMNGGMGGSGGPVGSCDMAGSGGGGGGASGGGILLYGTTVNISGAILSANGGGGASPGFGSNSGQPGFQGGGGRIKIFYYDLDTSGSSLSVSGFNVGTNVALPINPRPEKPELYFPPDALYGSSLPKFQLNATDAEGDTLQYKIELNATSDFTSPLKVFDQVASIVGWSAPSYPSGDMAAYTVQPADILSVGMTYFWRAFAHDGISWSVPSGIFSFTVDGINPMLSNNYPTNNEFVNDSQQMISIEITDGESGIDESALNISVEGTYYDTSSLAVAWDGLNLTFDPAQIALTFNDAQVVDVIVNASDNASNSNETSWSFIVDISGPTTTLLIGSPNFVSGPTTYFNESTLFTLNADDGPGIGTASTWFRIWDRSSGWTGLSQYSLPFTISGSNGPRYVEYNTTDNLGNQELAQNYSSISELYLDGAEPVTVLTIGSPQHISGPDTFVNSSTEFNLSSTNEAGIYSIWYKLDSDPWTQFTINFTLSGEGAHDITYNATDNLGQKESPSMQTVIVDDTPPVTSLTIGSPKYVSGSATFFRSSTQFTLSSDDGSGCGTGSTWYRVWSQSSGWSGLSQYMAPFTISGTDGIHYIEYESYDNLGNQESSNNYSAISPLILDDTPPTTSLTIIGQEYNSGGQTYVSSSSLISLEATDQSGIQGIWFKIDSGMWTQYTGMFTITTEGSHTITYNSTDNLDQSESNNLKNLIVDDTAPSTSITIGSPSYGSGQVLVNSSTQFTLTSSDSSSGLNQTWYRFDNGSFVPYTAQFTLAGEPDGPHVIIFYSADNIGNEEDVKTQLVFLDNEAPSADAGDDSSIGLGLTVSFDGSGSSDNSGSIQNYVWTFTYDGQPVELQGISSSYPFGIVGNYEVTLTVTDYMGNSDSDTKWVNVTHSLDSDGDGLPDSWEIEKFGSLSEDASGDPDDDGLTNLQEYSLSTNPSDEDSDNDGLNDGDDPNPLVADTQVGGETTEVIPLWIWLVIAVLVILVIIISILFAVKSRSKATQEPGPPMQEEQLPPPPPME
jgi:hypothetical protein